jgi:hypothetical protein
MRLGGAVGWMGEREMMGWLVWVCCCKACVKDAGVGVLVQRLRHCCNNTYKHPPAASLRRRATCSMERAPQHAHMRSAS